MHNKLLALNETMGTFADLYESADKSTLTKEERNKLDDDEFAIPEDRKFPINDAKHISSAKGYFKFVPEKKRKAAANRIFDKMVELDLPLQAGEDVLWTVYLTEDREEIVHHSPMLHAKDIERKGTKWVIKEDKLEKNKDK